MIVPRSITTTTTLLKRPSAFTFRALLDKRMASTDRAQELESSLSDVRARIQQASKQTPDHLRPSKEPVLVAVSKYKPADDVRLCYEHFGQLDLGENYVAELIEKAAQLPAAIRWHFIGTLQSNKCKSLAAIPNLFAIQTLDSAKKATTLNKSLPSTRTDPLNVFIQVNTSGEESKSGLSPLSSSMSAEATTASELVTLARHIVKDCGRLHLRGLMTIGSIEQSTSDEPNQDFATLVETASILESILRDEGAQRWGVDGRMELSMGMSADFEQAIKAGAGTVRVGTGIFGARKTKVEAASDHPPSGP